MRRGGRGWLRTLQERAQSAAAVPAEESAKKIGLTVNGKHVEVPEGSTILDATRALGIHVPTLCQHPRLPTTPGTCRVCQVETDRGTQIACGTPVYEGMRVETSSQRVNDAVRGVLSLFKANHPRDCMNCDAAGKCEFQDLIARYNIKGQLPPLAQVSPEWAEFKEDHAEEYHDSTSMALSIDLEKCVKCGRCITMCQDVQKMNILGWVNRGRETHPGVISSDELAHTKCIECGQCSTVCPVGAIVEHTEWRQVLNELETRKKVMVCQTAPSIRVSIGEEVGMAPGSFTTGKMVTAQRMMGFDYVFDANFSADLTIMEEGTELLQRLLHAWSGPSAEGGHGESGHHAPGPLPMFTSCCPAWINLVEKSYPELIPHVSTCKSPQMMMGAVVKHYWTQKMGLKPEDVCLVGVMPCVAKKHETERVEFRNEDGTYDCDLVVTTREFGHILRHKKIPLASLPDGEFDNPLGEGTGAAQLFGATGGVMEAALRTAYEVATGESLPKLEIDAVRGMQSIKAATIVLPDNEKTRANGAAGKEVRVAVASGIANALELLRQMRAGEAHYDFIEVMACPGGCIGGGGQPKTQDPTAVSKRMAATYKVDREQKVRKSHENESIKRIYAEFFGAPGAELAHKLLHTKYTDLSRETLPSVKEMTKDDELRAAADSTSHHRLRKISLHGVPQSKK